MLYISTRQSDQSNPKSFREVFLCGLGEDGGLFVPQSIPIIDLHQMYDLKFEEIAYVIFRNYVSCHEIPDDDLKELLNASFKTFRSDQVTPLIKLDDNLYILELFHGPSFSFKDIALQVVGNLFSYFVSNKHRTIVTATSGDTGSAAIYSVKGKRGLSCFVLFPKNNISAIQQAQMATESVTNANIHTIAVEGTFDDCQDAVKALFMDTQFKELVGLSAVNSINWARVLTQMTYYFYAFTRIARNPEEAIQFSVPTGNFGDILAGYYALRMGLPIRKLIIATNKNDILTRFMSTGVYRRTDLVQTLAPAMDITISSNFERLLWHFLQGATVAPGVQIASWMDELKRVGEFSVPSNMLHRIQDIFTSQSIDDESILKTIRSTIETYDYLIDPHTATAVYAAERNGSMVTVCLATAHPGKFPETIQQAFGVNDINFVPQQLYELVDKPQIIDCMKVDNLVVQLKKFILDRVG